MTEERNQSNIKYLLPENSDHCCRIGRRKRERETSLSRIGQMLFSVVYPGNICLIPRKKSVIQSSFFLVIL